MSFEAWLTDRCTIKRRSGSTEDSHGQRSDVYAAVATDVPCKIIHRDGRKVGSATAEQMGNISARVSTVSFLPGVDVREHDRLTIDSVEYAIARGGVVPAVDHHLDVAVETVKP